jgi:hypothetical protein
MAPDGENNAGEGNVRYVDLRRRRYETRPRRPAGLPPGGPYLLLALGFVLGLIVSPVFHAGGPDPTVALLLLIATGTLAVYLGWLLGKRHPRSTSPKTGGEKQLLMAILDAGGGITPVEAALRTSLTVDEAEQVLTRFANRGHLLVQSRDGALLYAMPGKNPSYPKPEAWHP